MAEAYNFMEGSQADINRRLLRKILALEASGDYDDTEIKALQEIIGDEDTGLVKAVADIVNAIGDESTEGTILARIKALEDA